MSKHGIQITSSRVGKLEKELIQYTLNLPKSSVGLDLGAGNGFISIIMSLLQKNIYLYDLKINFKLKIFQKIFSSNKLHLRKKNLKNVDYVDFPKNIDFVYSARFLHYLTYLEAENLLRKFSKNMKSGAKIFITVSGIDSDIGKNYSCSEKIISERNCFISKLNQSRFEIKEKVTLYTKKELEILMENYFIIEKSWESDFKNIFIIGVKK